MAKPSPLDTSHETGNFSSSELAELHTEGGFDQCYGTGFYRIGAVNVEFDDTGPRVAPVMPAKPLFSGIPPLDKSS